MAGAASVAPAAVCAAPPLELRTGDGLQLRIAPDGAIMGASTGAGPEVAAGGFSLADRTARPARGLDDGFLPLRGRATGVNGSANLELTGADGVRVKATLSAAGARILFDCRVEDPSGRDRAVAVRCTVPLRRADWLWHDDAEVFRRATPGAVCRRTENVIWGDGQCSPYPWACVSSQAEGISLGVPLGQGPRVVLLDFSPEQQALRITCYLGLTPAYRKSPGAADFSFELYRHDPAQGFRGSAEKYMALHAADFDKRGPATTYLGYGFDETYDPRTRRLRVAGIEVEDISDFGEARPTAWHMHGTYDFRLVSAPEKPQPTDAEARAALRLLAQQGAKSGYVPPDETLKKLMEGPDGRIQYNGDTQYWPAHTGYNKTDAPGWGLNFLVCENPDVSPVLLGQARETLEKSAGRPGFARWTWLVTADAFAGLRTLNCRREHIEASTIPPTYGAGNRAIGLHDGVWEFQRRMHDLTTRLGFATSGNVGHILVAFCAPFCDVPMMEGIGELGRPDRTDRYLRFIGGGKSWRLWRAPRPVGRAEVQATLERALGSGFFPPVGTIASMQRTLEPVRDLFRRYVPAIEQLNAAGWRPVPHAAAAWTVGGAPKAPGADAPSPWCERFGEASACDLHVTFRNPTAMPATGSVRLDLVALGLSGGGEVGVCDLLQGLSSWRRIDPARWEVALPPQGSAAYWVGTRAMLRAHAARLAEATLRRAGDAAAGAGQGWAGEARSVAAALAAAGGDAAALRAAADRVAPLRARCTGPAASDLNKLLTRAQSELAAATAP
jgi:hypothetical protein